MDDVELGVVPTEQIRYYDSFGKKIVFFERKVHRSPIFKVQKSQFHHGEYWK